MDAQPITINKVILSDLMELQKLASRTFSESFGPDNTKENLERYLANSFSTQKIKEELTNPESEFYFAHQHEIAVGYLKVNYGHAQTELQNLNATEIERIYVIQHYQGKQIGQLLFNKALELAKSRRADNLWLGVWERNVKAIKFYEKSGFVQFGKHAFMLGDDKQIDILMKLEIA